MPPAENVGNIIDKVSAKNQARKTDRKKKKLLKRQEKFDEREQLQQYRRGSADKVPSVTSWETGSTKIKSNAMEYDDSSLASSDSDDSAMGDETTTLQLATSKANAKAADLNAKANEKLSAGKRVEKVERDRMKELERIEEKWVKEKMKVEEMREKRLEKRIQGNHKRQEKVGKRMQRLEWIVVDNLLR